METIIIGTAMVAFIAPATWLICMAVDALCTVVWEMINADKR
jgi:hypothetical protein